MGAINYLQNDNIEPTHQLLALAVFVDSLKPDYVRSIHVHEENVGSLYTIQQEFLLNPGEYVRVREPVVSGSFRTSLTAGAGMKQIVDAMIKMHHREGWHCLLEYQRDSPSETFLPFRLTPSRNVDLKSVPSLEQDLKLVENALMSSSRNTHIMFNNDEIITNHGPCGEGKIVHRDDFGWFSSGLTLSCPSSLTLLGHLNDRIPGLETPERTPHGQQFDIWQNWGSELELASPEISHNRTSQSNQAFNSSSLMSSQNAGYAGAFWNPTTLLDLNLELTEFPSQDKDVDCSLVLSSPVGKPTSCLNLQLGMPSLSLQQSTITEDSMDCFTLECFGDSPPSYNMAAVDPFITKPTATTVSQSSKSMWSDEDSVGCHGCVINMSPWDVNGYSSMASSDMHSQKSTACMNAEKMPENSPTSIRYSAAHMKNGEYGKVSKGSLATSSVLYSVPYKKNAGYSNSDLFENYPTTSITSGDIHSAAYKKNVGSLNGDKGSLATSSEHSWREQGKESSARASCSSVSTQSVRQGLSQADTGNKPRVIRPGNSGEKLPEITLQELSQYFSMPITQASKALKVGLTVLKKRCRQYGIPRWPHRKMKSIDSLIYNIQDLAEDQGAKTSPRVQNAVKELEEQKRLMEEMPGVELAERTKKLRQACFKANYKKRKLGITVGIGQRKPPGPLPSSISHSFNILNPNTLIVPSPPNHHTMDHFL